MKTKTIKAFNSDHCWKRKAAYSCNGSKLAAMRSYSRKSQLFYKNNSMVKSCQGM